MGSTTHDRWLYGRQAKVDGPQQPQQLAIGAAALKQLKQGTWAARTIRSATTAAAIFCFDKAVYSSSVVGIKTVGL